VNRIAGRRVAAHASAAGKVLLAALPPAARSTLYDSHGLPSITARTIVSQEAFEAELAKVRAAGYATNLGEREDGVFAVAVPILDLSDKPLAALAVAAPAVRLPQARIPGLVRDLRRTRDAIQRSYFAQ
jgi:DNA-binding IclR family transcriptional regulator